MTPQRLIILTIAVFVLVLAAIVLLPRLGGSAVDAADSELALEAQPVLGEADAPVEVVLFEDFLCPHCGTFAEDVLPRIRRDFVDAGQARVFYKNFVVIGPEARRVAHVGECVFEQGNDHFWAVEPVFYRAQDDLDESRALELAQEYVGGLDGEALEQCAANDGAMEALEQDMDHARELGLSGTPSVLVNGQQVSNPTYQGVASAIEAALPAD